MALRVGILAPDLDERHGWGSYSVDLLRALQRRGIELRIVAAEDSPRLHDLAAAYLLPSVSPLRRAFPLRLLLALPGVRAALTGCDLIHVLAEPYAPLGAWIAGRRPLIISGHGTYVRMGERPGPAGALYRRSFRRGLLICVSRYTETVARGALPGVRTQMINNGVDAARYLDIDHTPVDPPTILTVGAVKTRKGTRELVKALAVVRERVPDARLVVAGSLATEPDYVAALRTEIDALGLTDAVDLLGRVPDETLRHWFSVARVFALPSQNVGNHFEGFGLVLMEASAAGLPVIGSRDCGAEDAVDDGATGLLVAQGDVPALANAIGRLLTDDALAAQMGAAGRAKAAAQTWDVAAASYAEVYAAELQPPEAKS